MNVELGFKRIFWIISGFGVLAVVAGLIGILAGQAGSPEVINMLLGGPLWFGFVWIVFFTTRWIIRGFQGKK